MAWPSPPTSHFAILAEAVQEIGGVGFTINPYDWCVTNKLIWGTQCMIIWHIDDLEISHVDPKAVDEVISLLQAEFGQEGPLTMN